MFRRLAMIQDALIDAGLRVRDFVVRADKDICRQEGFQLGKLAQKKDLAVTITENGVKFQVDLKSGHKTGFFCDQRDNRQALAALTAGKKVLDVCCYSGGFSCYAATQGKAAGVQGVDLDEAALEIAHANATLNEAQIDFTHADAFDFLRRRGGRENMGRGDPGSLQVRPQPGHDGNRPAKILPTLTALGQPSWPPAASC